MEITRDYSLNCTPVDPITITNLAARFSSKIIVHFRNASPSSLPGISHSLRWQAKELARRLNRKLRIYIIFEKEDNILRYAQIFENFFPEIFVPLFFILEFTEFSADCFTFGKFDKFPIFWNLSQKISVPFVPVSKNSEVLVDWKAPIVSSTNKLKLKHLLETYTTELCKTPSKQPFLQYGGDLQRQLYIIKSESIPGVLQERLGGRVRRASQNPYPIYDQICNFPYPIYTQFKPML